MFYVESYIADDKVLVVDTDDYSLEIHSPDYLLEAAKFFEIKGVDLKDKRVFAVEIEDLIGTIMPRDRLNHISSDYSLSTPLRYGNAILSNGERMGVEYRNATLSLTITKNMTYRIPEGIRFLNSCTIRSDKFCNIVLPKSLKHISGMCFISLRGKDIKLSINLENVEYIGMYAFTECKTLTEITFSAIEDIVSTAFSKAGLRRVNVIGKAKDIEEEQWRIWFREVGHEVQIYSDGELLYSV